MSFDVVFQRFRDGEDVPGGGALMREVLLPHITKEEPEDDFAFIEFGDGTADVYLDEEDMMANHITGDDPWDLLVTGAKAANWVILAPGCPTCITSEAQRAHLPEGLDDDVVLVGSGQQLLQVIRSA